MVKKIFLIRHGQTDWNLEGRYQGHTDVDINATGRGQASKLSVRMQNEIIDRIYSSDRIRAIHSAKIIFQNRDIEIDPSLREISFGVFEGLDYKEILQRYPDIYSAWIKNPFDSKIPGGELPADFKKRVLSAFKNITLQNNGKVVAIIAHGGPVNVIVRDILGSKVPEDFIPGPTSVTVIEFKNGKTKDISLNDMSHIDGK
jgi:broad specificity phosphatase PhoE